jgi:hypothetical protein
MPKYRSDLHLNQLMKKDDKSDFELDDVSDDLKKGSRSCKILLLFSEDGVAASDLAISLAEQVTVDVSFTWLNQSTTKYSPNPREQHRKSLPC